MFPEWARIIVLYLKEQIEKPLINEISKFSLESKYVKDFSAVKEVIPDLILVSSRHLFRMPYSLHEKTALSSVVLEKSEIGAFNPRDAEAFKVKIRSFMPESRENEAKELLIQALDWYKEANKEEKKKDYSGKKFEVIDNKYITEDMFPPVIKNILQGVKSDGRKRALFVLITFFRSLGFSDDYINKTINEWNNKNYKPLKQGYIKTQIEWNKRQKKNILPPNFESDYYKAIEVYEEDALTKRVKNPVSYTLAKARERIKTTKQKRENIK